MKQISAAHLVLLGVLLVFAIATVVLSVIILTKTNEHTSTTECGQSTTVVPTTQSSSANFVDWRSRSIYHEHRIQVIVLHDTETASAEETVEVLNRRHLSVHYIIETNGTVYYLVDEAERAYHAGTSGWGSHVGLNDASIGIEIVNSGVSDFTDVQVKSVAALCKLIMDRWSIWPQNIVAHGDIAPSRKQDVSGYFNWKMFYAEVGLFPGLFVSNITADQQKQVLLPTSNNSNADDPAVKHLQQRLSDYGYASNIEVNGRFDEDTQYVVEAFNRHFCPEIFVKETEDANGDYIPVLSNRRWYGVSEERLIYLLKYTNRDLCPQC